VKLLNLLAKLFSPPALAVGDFFVEADQPPLAPVEIDIINRFHDLYYRRWQRGGADSANLSWFGHNVRKCPLDLWVYQELLVRTRPDVIVETGTLFGGSAFYLATILDLIGHGSIVTVDINDRPGRQQHPRITYLTGSSTDPAIVRQVKDIVQERRAMVLLDSDHSESHVSKEIAAYAPLVRVGDYLIVEDTNVNGHPTYEEYGAGPMEAVQNFLAENDEFAVDGRCERFLMTFNPRGYLRRVKPTPAFEAQHHAGRTEKRKCGI
jgi:cephalosporin hydroxylase